MTTFTTHLDDDAVSVLSTSVSAMDNRCYVITSKADGTQVLIDAADDTDTLLALLAAGAATVDEAAAARLSAVATTHSHWDHTRALAAIAASEDDPTLIAGANDVEAIRAERDVAIDAPVDHGDVGDFGSFSLTAVHLRGHTPGSIAYVLERPEATLIFSGDSLFPGGVGNTDKDPARFASLIDDVEERLFGAYPDDALVLPGHGEPTTLGAERPQLGAWRERGW